jgi:hypothetical protein
MVQKIVDPYFHIQTFNVKVDKQLSPIAETILKSFKYKLYYYVIDDLLYLLKSDPNERDYLLNILHSSVIFLQNNLYVNFFDIYVYEININEISKFNRFINEDSKSYQKSTQITIKLAYQVKTISKKLETIW